MVEIRLGSRVAFAALPDLLSVLDESDDVRLAGSSVEVRTSSNLLCRS